jgi:hypothetical protein
MTEITLLVLALTIVMNGLALIIHVRGGGHNR